MSSRTFARPGYLSAAGLALGLMGIVDLLRLESAAQAPGVTAPTAPAMARANGATGATGAANAEALYRRHCQSCHGAEGQGARKRRVVIPDFRDPAWQAARADAQLTASLLNGKGDEMPPFDDRLTAAEVRDLVAYLRVFAPAPAASGPAAPTSSDARMRELQRQWADLEVQMRQLKSASRRD